MKSYTISDAEKILSVKAHVIRYWESEVPLIQPKKEASGRKVYSEKDLQLLLRLKHLLYKKRYTLEGAKDELIRELSGSSQDLRGEIALIRSKLLDLYFLAKK